MALTSDPRDPRLGRGPSGPGAGQSQAYLILPAEALEGEGAYKRPIRHAYSHDTCHMTTSMADGIARTYARNPDFYGFTYCCFCGGHFPVSEFRWVDEQTGEVTQERVGT